MTKQEYRAALKQKRASITPEQRKAWDTAIVERIAASEVFQNASAVLLYAPVGSEINLLPLARIARERGKRIAFPRCDVETNTMQFFYLEPNVRLSLGAYQIPEPPADAPLCEPDETALCILPALTFDLSGARLGYGKGYYDRFLATFPGVSVGAVYTTLLVRRVPTEPHDLPVSMLFTEYGVRNCQKSETPTTDGNASLKNGKEATASPLRDRIESFFKKRRHTSEGTTVTSPVVQNGQAQRREETNESTLPKAPAATAQHAPPILVACCFVLLLLSRLIDTRLTNRDNEFLVVILMQLMIFLVPAIVYGKLRGDAFPERIRLRLPRPEHLWFTACMLIVMISGALLCEILTGGIASLTGNFTLYSTFIARINGSALETVYVILAYGILPAFCEELIFRSILCAEYERFGVGVSIAVSALFFAMLHFSFALLPAYLFVGALLAFSMYATRSFFTAFLLHTLYNLFCLFGQPYLSAFYVHAGNNDIFVFCLVTLFLLFSAFATGEARKLYHLYARANADASYTAELPLRALPKQLLRSLLSPATAVCLLIWLIMAIVNAVA